MSCNCKLYRRRIEKLQKKYGTMKKNYRKLIGVTVLLTEAIEQFVKGEMKTGINDTLSTCCSIYPDLFTPGYTETLEAVDVKPEPQEEPVESNREDEEVFKPATESEKEYYEGFMARPRIPRTPQV